MGEEEKCARDLVGIPERKKQIGRPRHGWEDNITMYLKQIGRDGFHGAYLAQDGDMWRSLVRIVMTKGRI